MRFDPIAKLFCRPDLLSALREGAGGPPVSAEVDVTDRCNLNCSFCCWPNKDPNRQTDVSLEDGRKMIAELKKAGLRSIVWSGGGEPMMNPVFLDLVEEAAGAGLQCGLFTNGTLINSAARAETLLRRCSWIRVSVMAAGPASYKKLAGSDMFDSLCANLRLLAEIRNKEGLGCVLGAGAIVEPDMLPDLEPLANLLESTGFDFVQFKHNNLSLGDPDYSAFWKERVCPEASRISKSRGAKFKVEWTDKNYLPPYEFGQCLAAHFSMIVRPDGTVVGCKLHRFNEAFEFGNILKEDINVVLGRRNEIINKFDPAEQCTLCPNKELNALLRQFMANDNPNMNFL